MQHCVLQLIEITGGPKAGKMRQVQTTDDGSERNSCKRARSPLQ